MSKGKCLTPPKPEVDPEELIRLEKEVKAKNEEIQELQDQVSKEQAEKQRLQKLVDGVNSSQADTGRKLSRALETSNKLRNEVKAKAEIIEKLERNISHMEDRMRNLEIRASEVEKAELTLESTKRNLEAAQQEVRMRDRELERAQEKYDTVCKDLEITKSKVGELENKIEDLKIQVRHELMKNENIERGLETIPRLKDEISERDQKIKALEKDLEERSVLLSASRKAAREYKERLRDLERRDEESISLKEELELTRSEVNTLKRLMSGKDSIVMQRCHQLEQAKATVDSLRRHASSDEEKAGLRKIQNVLEQLKQLHVQAMAEDMKDGLKERPQPHNRFAQSRPRSATGDHHRVDINHHPYVIDNNKENSEHYQQFERTGGRTTQEGGKSSTYIFLERFLDDTSDITPIKSSTNPKQSRAKTAQPIRGGGATVKRSASFHNGGSSPSPYSNNSSNSNNVNSSGLAGSRKAVSTHNIRGGSSRLCSPRSKREGPGLSTKTSTLYYSGRQGSASNLYTSETSSKLTSKYQPSLEYSLGVSTDDELTTDTSQCLSLRDHPQQHKPPHRPKSAFAYAKRGHSNNGSDTESGSLDNNAIADIVGGPLTSQQLTDLATLSAAQKDAILNDVIQIGDRVSITVAQKPPRYGRKKPKPITYTGIVKYKGNLDKEHYDARIYVGLRLDAPLGDTDGTYKGKRYMFTPPEHAKFFKIRDLDTVLDVPSSMYIPTSKLILYHKENNGHLYSSSNTNTRSGDVTHSHEHEYPAHNESLHHLHNGHHSSLNATS